MKNVKERCIWRREIIGIFVEKPKRRLINNRKQIRHPYGCDKSQRLVCSHADRSGKNIVIKLGMIDRIGHVLPGGMGSG